jgi:Putative transposase
MRTEHNGTNALQSICAVFPRRVLAAGPNRRARLPEQGRDLRHPIQGLGRDLDHHRGRSQTSGCPHRRPFRSSHLGLIVPGGGISLDGERWIACRPNFFLPVRVLSRLFRRLVLQKLADAHRAGELQFFGKHTSLTNTRAFAAYLAPVRNSEWVVYSKRPFGGPEEVLRYLARYTHRVAISNRRLVSLDDNGVTFKWKDYRLDGPERYGLMKLNTQEFIRRFLMHVLPAGFHRIRYYGLFTSQTRAKNIARIRDLLAVPLIPIDAIKASNAKSEEQKAPEHLCPCCGGRMRIIEIFLRGQQPRHPPTSLPPKIRIDTS